MITDLELHLRVPAKSLSGMHSSLFINFQVVNFLWQYKSQKQPFCMVLKTFVLRERLLSRRLSNSLALVVS